MKYGKIVKFNAIENRKKIENDSKGLLSFGISFLDDCFLGIKKNDFVCIGADSGLGKTELSANIACYNAQKGKKVYFYALESYEREIERRIAFKIASNKYYHDANRKHFDVSFPLYENNKIDKAFLPYAIYGEQEAERIYSENLNIVMRSIKGYNVNHFVEEFQELNLLADLIIIDHINYFDNVGKMTEQENLTYASKKINEMVNLHNVPVIVITHFNRSVKNPNQIVPDIHNIHGSSNLAKESTKIAFLSREKKEDDNPYLFPTFIYPSKFRGMGSINNYVGCVNFDIRTNRYDSNYIVGRLSFDKSKIDEYLQGYKIPFWAKNAK